MLPFECGGGDADREYIAQLMREFFPEEVSLSQQASELSQGQKQRLAFIRALLLEPDFLLCDEPTASLDPQSRQLLEARLLELNFHKKPGIIYISHDENSLLAEKAVSLRFGSEGLNEVKT